MNIFELDTFIAGSTKAVELAKAREEGLIVAVVENHWLATGLTDGTYSAAVQQELNIPVFKAQHVGGTCVVFPGDLSMCELRIGNSDFGRKILVALQNYLGTRNIRTRFDGNDLMVHSAEEDDWFKIASYGSGWIGKGFVQTVVHVSIGMDEDLVTRLCTKPCVKRPGGLEKYGVTSQDVYEVLKPTIAALYVK